MSTYRLTKKFRFESAHRLAKGYVGKCARLHGHSWHGELILAVTGLDQFDMALDFGAMGRITKAWEEQYDHKVLLYDGDPLHAGIVATLKDAEGGIVLFDANPTCETLARVLYEDAAKRLDFVQLPPGMAVLSHAVRIEETCTTSCTYMA